MHSTPLSLPLILHPLQLNIKKVNTRLSTLSDTIGLFNSHSSLLSKRLEKVKEEKAEGKKKLEELGVKIGEERERVREMERGCDRVVEDESDLNMLLKERMEKTKDALEKMKERKERLEMEVKEMEAKKAEKKKKKKKGQGGVSEEETSALLDKRAQLNRMSFLLKLASPLMV